MTKKVLVEFQDVKKSFGRNRVLDGVNLTIKRGQITTIIGKSGVGKSVLLKHIIGLLAPDSGRILFEGRPLSEMTRREKRALKERFSYMFQGTALFDSLSVFDNIALPLKEGGTTPRKEIAGKVKERMRQLELGDIDGKFPSQLSGGMRKRVALARALVTDPEIVLFDEPTTGLDPIRKNAVHSMIADYQKRFGFTGVIVSHEIPDVFFISQHVAFINEGRILFQGGPDEMQRSKDPVVQQFIHGLESRHDHLTGLAPIMEGERRFRDKIARLQQHRITFSLVLLTIENMDEVNIRAGYTTGQTLLRNFASVVQRHHSPTDASFRYGLNKIMLMLNNCDIDRARSFSAELLARLQEEGRQILTMLPHRDLDFSVSVGFAEAREESRLDELIAVAEQEREMFYEFNADSLWEES